MDLLNENNNNKKNKKTTGQKVILVALVISIILFIGILVVLMTLGNQTTVKKYTVALNGKEFNIESLEILELENRRKIYSIKKYS